MKQATMTAPGQIECMKSRRQRQGQARCCCASSASACADRISMSITASIPCTSYPVVQGHEFSAVLEATGSRRDGPARPAPKSLRCRKSSAASARPCRRGDYHICDNLKVQGFQAPGCAQELWVTSADKHCAAARHVHVRAGGAGGTDRGRRPCGRAGRCACRTERGGAGGRADRQPGGADGALRRGARAHHRPERQPARDRASVRTRGNLERQRRKPSPKPPSASLGRTVLTWPSNAWGWKRRSRRDRFHSKRRQHHHRGRVSARNRTSTWRSCRTGS